jgi:hypothetical protein
MRTITAIRIFFIFMLFISCNKYEQLKPLVGEVELSACKNNQTPSTFKGTSDTLSCIDYTYDPIKKALTINHINAGFNCCPGKISCTAILSGDTLIIEESESASLCDCNCLYDLTFTIDNIDNTFDYLMIKEPYWGGLGSIGFKISLENQKEGSWCTNRKNYPWGM